MDFQLTAYTTTVLYYQSPDMAPDDFYFWEFSDPIFLFQERGSPEGLNNRRSLDNRSNNTGLGRA